MIFPPVEFWPKVLFSALSFAAVLTACLAVVWAARLILRVNADRRHTIRLENRGNCRSYYLLSFYSEEPSLRFSLSYAGKELPQVIAQPEEPQPEASLAEARPSAGRPGPAKPVPPVSQPSAAMKTGQAAAAKAGTLASLLGGLGRLLPGSLGASLSARSAQARSVQIGTNRAMQAPQAIKGQVSAIQRDGSRLAGGKPAAPAQPPVRGAGRTSGVAAPTPEPGLQVHAVPGSWGLCQFQTPELAPGQALDLTLRIGTRARRYPAGSFAYRVISQQVAPEFPQDVIAPVSRGGVAAFPVIGAWRYWLPGLVSVVFVLAGLVSFIYLYLLIWQ
jgi:hypothetical protein